MGKTLEELLNELSEADAALLGEDCQALIRAIGLEGFKKLIQEFSGVQLYIPKQEKVCRYRSLVPQDHCKRVLEP